MSGNVVLLSGGMDSATLLAWVVKNSNVPILAVSFDYGQTHKSEIEAARKVADYYNIPHRIFNLPDELFRGSTSSLITGDLESFSMGTYEELQARRGEQPTVVPNRNMLLISAAAVCGLSTFGFCDVWTAPHAGDAHNWHYPDCTPEFLDFMDGALEVGNSNKVHLHYPFVKMTKGELVKSGTDMHVPYFLTTSCYKGEEGVACGECATCQERIHAFIEARWIDPIQYAIDIDWKGLPPYPWTLHTIS